MVACADYIAREKWCSCIKCSGRRWCHAPKRRNLLLILCKSSQKSKKIMQDLHFLLQMTHNSRAYEKSLRRTALLQRRQLQSNGETYIMFCLIINALLEKGLKPHYKSISKYFNRQFIALLVHSRHILDTFFSIFECFQSLENRTIQIEFWITFFEICCSYFYFV